MPTTSLFLLVFFFEIFHSANRHCANRHCEEVRLPSLRGGTTKQSFD